MIGQFVYKQDNTSKIAVLQGVRGMAISLVVISHCNKLFFNQQRSNALNWFGAFGVSIFILLSGFLAIYKYYEKSAADYYKGIKLRISKFYPLHCITLLLAVPLCFYEFTDKTKTGVLKFVINGMLLQSWVPNRSVYFSFNLVSWYLSTMIFFIAITPVIIHGLKLINRKITLIILAIVIIITEICFAIFIPENGELKHWLIYVCPLTRTLDFIAGKIQLFLKGIN